MAKNMNNFHPQPCANCAHQDMHGEVAGCIALASRNPDRWCDCAAYVSPRDRAQGLQEGVNRAVEGIQRAFTSYAMTGSPDGSAWREAAENRMAALISTGKPFTAEDVTDVVGVAPSPSAIGSLFKGRKDMTPVGFTPATRKEAHGRPLRVWQGTKA